MNNLVCNDKTKTIQELAAYVISTGRKAITENGRFNLVLTGGNSPKELHTLLATVYREKLDWTKVYFFMGDERNVPPGHENYNGLMAKKTLLDPLNIAANQIFFIDTTLAPELAASTYAQEIIHHFKGTEIAFDLILLGMGDDAHTASLFPETDVLENKAATVAAVFVEKLDTYRITFTAGLINNAKNIAFLVFGKSKAEALKHVLEGDKQPQLYPAQLIAPVNGSLTFYLDNEAAELLLK